MDNEILFPYECYTYWLNTKQKRVFLLSHCPPFCTPIEQWKELTCTLREWGKPHEPEIITALDFASLVETKALQPFTPKYLHNVGN